MSRLFLLAANHFLLAVCHALLRLPTLSSLPLHKLLFLMLLLPLISILHLVRTRSAEAGGRGALVVFSSFSWLLPLLTFDFSDSI